MKKVDLLGEQFLSSLGGGVSVDAVTLGVTTGCCIRDPGSGSGTESVSCIVTLRPT
jgi:hypothetical protein